MILDRLRMKLSLRRRRPGYRSVHGGLWTDRLDAGARLGSRLEQGKLDAGQSERLRQWIELGYVILPGAVPHELIDRVVEDVEDAWRRGDSSFVVELGDAQAPLDPALRARLYKLVDLYARSPSTLQAAFSGPIADFLRLVFERDILLFQSLSFEYGSGDPLHQDTAYVVVTSPLEFVACWIALEDVRPGSGELVYYPGSHRLPEVHFARSYPWRSSPSCRARATR
jgi:hypothetical protein